MIGFLWWMVILAVLFAGVKIMSEDGLDKFWAYITFYLSGVIWFFAGITAIIMLCDPSNYDSVSQDSLVNIGGLKSLTANTEVKKQHKGVFFLGSGGFSGVSESEQYYYVIVDYPDKGMKIEKFKLSETYIKEEDTDSPYVESSDTKEISTYKENWFIGGLFSAKGVSESTHLNHYILHVPIGTVIIDYNVDLKDLK